MIDTMLHTAAGFGTGGISAWIQNNVVPIVLLVAAVAALWAGKSGNISKIVTILVCCVLGLSVLALATTGAGAEIGTWIVSLVRSPA
ncbi:hypothetical protein [Pengzhenrongella sp.]|uniref:hypothetical protein n=1 Tax=Pengzhenrongella sp. TaxID=2888820 RepID=UPI002F95C3B1